MATHSSIPAWGIPWPQEPGGLQSLGLQSQTQLSMHTPKPQQKGCLLSQRGKGVSTWRMSGAHS